MTTVLEGIISADSQDTLAEIMAGGPEEDQRKVLRDNAARMCPFGLQ